MPRTSRYALIVDNISSSTPVRDIEKEFDRFGRVRDCIKDSRHRLALVEFEKTADADAAWRKMDGFRLDGRTWKVEFATRDDFKFFGWKWFEHSPSPPRRRYRSPSRSRSPPPRKSSLSPPRRSRSRSPDTPHGKNDKPRDASRSASPQKDRRQDDRDDVGGRARSPSRSPSRSPRRD